LSLSLIAHKTVLSSTLKTVSWALTG